MGSSRLRRPPSPGRRDAWIVELIAEVWQEIVAERKSDEGRVLTGTVRWWKDEKGYGRITGDDGYIYFCHISGLGMDGYKTLQKGQRVEFNRSAHVADHGRAVAENVRVID